MMDKLLWKISSKVCHYSRKRWLGTHCPPMYKDWAEVPDLTKDALWKKVLVEIDLPLIRKECTLRKLNTAWKQKKYELRQVYDKFPTDAERKRNVPSKVKKEEWEAFVDMCSPPTGEVSRTEGYVAIHMRRDGSCINFETKQSLEEIDRLVSNEPDIVERDLDNDPIALVIGRDGRGRVRGLGSGVTKTVYHASTPYKEIAQREKRARENSESGYEAIMARLDEADKARKILEDEVADLKRQYSGIGNASQDLSKLQLEAMGIQHKLVVQRRVELDESTVKSIDSFSSPSPSISLSLASHSCSPTSSAGIVNSKSKNSPSSLLSSSTMWRIVVVGLVLVLVLVLVRGRA
ncbi:hypothetical protein IFM89_037786 [Coptis chinensis]|uniref:Transposase n=1 Tax=Coptis chinensis TaxID=261450 RepID=A0A835HA33_9MAGN|nr:hypothetical protein IFM89_037786 [Coptis chinensis]